MVWRSGDHGRQDAPRKVQTIASGAWGGASDGPGRVKDVAVPGLRCCPVVCGGGVSRNAKACLRSTTRHQGRESYVSSSLCDMGNCCAKKGAPSRVICGVVKVDGSRSRSKLLASTEGKRPTRFLASVLSRPCQSLAEWIRKDLAVAHGAGMS